MTVISAFKFSKIFIAEKNIPFLCDRSKTFPVSLFYLYLFNRLKSLQSIVQFIQLILFVPFFQPFGDAELEELRGILKEFVKMSVPELP